MKDNKVDYYNEKLSELLKQAKEDNFEMITNQGVLMFKEIEKVETLICKQKYNLI